MSLPGTKQKSGVDGGYPAESAVRCDKLMANLTQRCCQAGRGGSCSTRDSLSLQRTLMWHRNLFQASLRRCLQALISPERWGTDEGRAETSCQWNPVDLSQQRGWLLSKMGFTPQKVKIHATTCVLQSEITLKEILFFYHNLVTCYWVEDSSRLSYFDLKYIFYYIVTQNASSKGVSLLPVLLDFHSSAETLSAVVISSLSLKS